MKTIIEAARQNFAEMVTDEDLQDLTAIDDNYAVTRDAFLKQLEQTWYPLAKMFLKALAEHIILYDKKPGYIVSKDLTIYSPSKLSYYCFQVKYKKKTILNLGIDTEDGYTSKPTRLHISGPVLQADQLDPEKYKEEYTPFYNPVYRAQVLEAYNAIKEELKQHLQKKQFGVDYARAMHSLSGVSFEEKSLQEADISGEALTHTTHVEDNLYNGSKAAHFALDALYSVYEMLAGSTPRKQVKVTTKWDGAPSCVAASNFQGKAFVATKGFFAKDRKIAYTAEDCQKYFGHAPDLARKMTLLLQALPELGIPSDQIWQGDFLFDSQTLKPETIDGEKYLTFHPNTIVYAVPEDDPLAARLAKATFGVVWHTRYRGNDVDHLKISFDVDADELNETAQAFCMDARLLSIAGRVTLTAEETAKIDRILEEITSVIEGLDARRYLDKIAENEELVLYLNTFENFGIKQNSAQLGMEPAKHITALRKWVSDRYNKEIATKKQPKTKEAYELKRDQALALIDSIAGPLSEAIRAQQMIVTVKEFLIQKLNRAANLKTLLKTIDRGFIPTGPEGYAISDVDGNIQKFVSRLEFSYSNFSKEVVKGWMSDSRMQESSTINFLKEKLSVPELKQSIIANTQASEDPRALVKAYNALSFFDTSSVKEILKTRYVVPETLDRVAKIVARGRPDIENDDFLRILQAIVSEGVIPIPVEGQRIDFIEVSRENTKLLANRLNIQTEDALQVLDSLIEDLLNDSFPQRGIVVGAGEVLFALLMKGGSKREVGDLTLQGHHVEVKGVGARLVGAADQGGLNGKPSQHGTKLRRLITSYAGREVPSINISTGVNISLNGPAALREAMPLIANKREFSLKYADILLDVVLRKPPEAEKFKVLLAKAIETESWAALHKAYAMYHYTAYQHAAGWEMLLQFSGKNHQILLTSTAAAFYNAFEQNLSFISPFSFSPGTKAEGGELGGGFSIKVLAPGESSAERAEERQAKKSAKDFAKYTAKLDEINKAIAAQEAKLGAVTAPSKRAKATEMLAKYKIQAAELAKRLEELQ